MSRAVLEMYADADRSPLGVDALQTPHCFGELSFAFFEGFLRRGGPLSRTRLTLLNYINAALFHVSVPRASGPEMFNDNIRPEGCLGPLLTDRERHRRDRKRVLRIARRGVADIPVAVVGPRRAGDEERAPIVVVTPCEPSAQPFQG